MKRDYFTKAAILIIVILICCCMAAGAFDEDSTSASTHNDAETDVLLTPEESAKEPVMQEKQQDTLLTITSLIPAKEAMATEELPSFIEKRGLKFSKLFLSIFTFIFSWLLIKYVNLFLNLLSEKWYKYRITIKGLIPVFRTIAWTIAISFIIIGIIKPPIQSVLALTASAGIAIGFASQDILKNIFGGIIILMDKPFMVGDKIRLESHYGEVISIGLRTVRIVTPDDSMVSIPNSEVVSKSVSNANSGESDCQVVAEFFFEPDIDMEKAHSLAVKCASLSRYVFLNKPIAAVFMNEMYMGKSMIKLRLKAYVFDHRYEFAFITDMSKIVIKEFEKAGLTPHPVC